MSLFRRKLLTEDADGNKPNLAVVTESTFEVTEFNRASYPAGVTANLKTNTVYNVSFTLEATATDVASASANIWIQNPWPDNHWIDFIKERLIVYPIDIGIKQKIEYVGEGMSLKKDMGETDKNLIMIDSNSFKGNIKITNFIVTEA